MCIFLKIIVLDVMSCKKSKIEFIEIYILMMNNSNKEL